MGGPRTLKLADGLTTPDSKKLNVTTCYTGLRAWKVILNGPLKSNRMGRDGLDSFGLAQRQAASSCNRLSDSIRKKFGEFLD